MGDKWWAVLWGFVFALFISFPASSGPADLERGVQLLEQGERRLEGPCLFEAEAILLRECQGVPRDDRCEYLLARVYLANYSYWREVGKDRKKARAALALAEYYGEAAVRRRPNDAWAHVLLGRIYQVKLLEYPVSGVAAAIFSESPVLREYQRALELDPTNGEAELGLGIYYQFMPRVLGGDGHRARTHFKRAARLLPNNPEPLVWICISYREEGRLAEARKFLNRALALDPNNRFVQAEQARLAAAEKAQPQKKK